jgi:hypothetical protein
MSISAPSTSCSRCTEDSPEVGEVLAELGAHAESVRDAVMVRLSSPAGAEPAEP